MTPSDPLDTRSAVRRTVATGVATLLVATLVGCGKSGPPGTIWVSGAVLYDGKSLPDGAVHFAAKGKATPATAAARLVGSRYGLYLVPGAYAVAVVSEEGVPVMDMKTGLEIPAKSRIPRKYTTVTTSGLEATFDNGHRTSDLSLAP